MRILSKSKTIDQEPLQAGARNQLRIAIEERDAALQRLQQLDARIEHAKWVVATTNKERKHEAEVFEAACNQVASDLLSNNAGGNFDSGAIRAARLTEADLKDVLATAESILKRVQGDRIEAQRVFNQKDHDVQEAAWEVLHALADPLIAKADAALTEWRAARAGLSAIASIYPGFPNDEQCRIDRASTAFVNDLETADDLLQPWHDVYQALTRDSAAPLPLS